MVDQAKPEKSKWLSSSQSQENIYLDQKQRKLRASKWGYSGGLFSSGSWIRWRWLGVLFRKRNTDKSAQFTEWQQSWCTIHGKWKLELPFPIEKAEDSEAPRPVATQSCLLGRGGTLNPAPHLSCLLVQWPHVFLHLQHHLGAGEETGGIPWIKVLSFIRWMDIEKAKKKTVQGIRQTCRHAVKQTLRTETIKISNHEIN
jgi:hypothetical protein